MMDIHELREQYNTSLDEMTALVDAAELDQRDLTDDEQQQYDGLQERAASLRTRIERQEQLREARASMPAPSLENARPPEIHSIRTADASDFRSLGEFLSAVRFNPSDPRLHGQQADTRADLVMGTPALGGYLVPTTFVDELLQVGPGEAVVRPRARVIPAGTYPDGKITFPALDQSGTKGIYSGVTVDWIGEGDDKPETNPTFREVVLEPHEVAATVVVTDKLLRNAPIADATIRQLLRGAIVAAEDVAFLTGDGVGKPTGLIGHASNVEVARATANEIAYEDIVNMVAAFMGDDGYFLASATTLPYLMRLTDGAGQLIWQPSARDGVPGTLIGYPVVLNHRQPTLGTAGDLVLADLDHYIIKDGSPLVVSASEHVLFRSNKTVIKAFWMVDGKPALTTPIQAEDGTTVSPFVTLGVPTP